jgi:hypothetical protein
MQGTGGGVWPGTGAGLGMNARGPARYGDTTQTLLQALLDHFWEARRKRVPREPKLFPGGYLISYSSLIARAGVAVEARRLGGPLAEIGALCELKGWPPLAALVVRQDAGQPGVGYFRRPGSPKVDLVTEEHLDGWEADARACIAFEKMPRRAPAVMQTAR